MEKKFYNIGPSLAEILLNISQVAESQTGIKSLNLTNFVVTKSLHFGLRHSDFSHSGFGYYR